MAKKKFNSLDSIFENNKSSSTTINIKKYHSNYNYEKIREEDVEKLTISEEEILINKSEINKGYFKIAKSLYEANKILASYDNTSGKFINWFENLGLKKTFVYNSIKRYNLYLLSNDEEKVNRLSQKAIEIIGSKKVDDEIKLKLLKEEGIEKISDKELKEHILNIISERSEMIGEKDEIENAEIVEEKIDKEEKEKQFLLIKRLLSKVENKFCEGISKSEFHKLKRIEEILKEL